MVRARNGFWWGPEGPRYTRVSGVLVGDNLMPWTYGAHALTLYENPWAKVPISGPITKLPRKVPIDGEMRGVEGLRPREILGLPVGYPGLAS